MHQLIVQVIGEPLYVHCNCVHIHTCTCAYIILCYMCLCIYTDVHSACVQDYNYYIHCSMFFQRAQELYQSRCSCLIGVADVYRNLTGDFPQSLTMSGCCYACKLLEPNFFMVSSSGRRVV